MLKLADLDQVKGAHPPIEHDDDDDALTLLIAAASEKVARYLGGNAAAVLGLNEAGEVAEGFPLPSSVTVAVIFLTRDLYQGGGADGGGVARLPRRVEMLLYDLARPTVV